MDIAQLINSLLTLVVGVILGTYLKSRFEHQKEVNEDIHQLKRKRYGAILIQMLTVLNSDSSLTKVQEFRPDLKSIEDFKDEIKVEMLHSIVFANDDVIKAMADFIKDSNYTTYIKTASAMRKDLWGKGTKIGEDVLRVFSKL